MKASIMNLVETIPSGLMELKPAMTISGYRDNFGFDLKNIHTIYQSKRINSKREEWFAFPRKTLKDLFTVQKESNGDLLVLYIAEVIKNGKVYCYLVLSDQAYQKILDDKSSEILQVHQMYSKFWQDYIALNSAN